MKRCDLNQRIVDILFEMYGEYRYEYESKGLQETEAIEIQWCATEIIKYLESMGVEIE